MSKILFFSFLTRTIMSCLKKNRKDAKIIFCFFQQKWKKNWFVLYPASQNGIARLEFFDSPSGGGGSGGGSGGTSNEKTRKLDKKIIRLSECISILPTLADSYPKENMEAFCVETNDKMHVFAAEKNAAKEWMHTMCEIAFQVCLYLSLY